MEGASHTQILPSLLHDTTQRLSPPSPLLELSVFKTLALFGDGFKVASFGDGVALAVAAALCTA
jgi:hypothetical protein